MGTFTYSHFPLLQIKQAVEDSEKELLEDIEAKEKKIQQLKRALDDNEYLHQTKYDDLFLGLIFGFPFPNLASVA